MTLTPPHVICILSHKFITDSESFHFFRFHTLCWRLWMKLKLSCAASVVITLTFLLPVPVRAQWLNYKTPGIPRTPDGKPNLSAPAPRSADGKPDLSGIWRAPANSPYLRNIAVDVKPGEIQPWAQALYQQNVFNLGADSPRAHCLPDPPPYYHLAGMSRIVQTPTVM